MYEQKFWVVAADMGYGHLRAAYPFHNYAEEKIISIGTDEYTSDKVKKQWSRIQGIYEFISRNKNLPFIGKHLFNLMDYMLKIPSYYPIKDLSAPTFQVKMLEKYIKDGLYDNMMEKIKTKDIPLLTTFYAPAIAADYFGYKSIYCVITDTDVNRVWVAKDPKKSKIKYFVPSKIAYGRLLQYGVPEANVFYTGFPISESLIGEHCSIAKESIAKRLQLLDPKGVFRRNFSDSVYKNLGFDYNEVDLDRTLTITYAVGGAGAQKEIAKKIITGLNKDLNDNKLKVNLVAGIRKEVRNYFAQIITSNNIDNVNIIYAENKEDYFKAFDETIKETDILWTKPSELTFYASLGLPVILSPSIGAQEIANKRWLRDDIAAGIAQKKPKYSNQWLNDYLDSGKLAEAAWFGYLKIEKTGFYKILNILKNQ